MHKFVRNLITEWRKLELPFSREAIVVAVSGGADSVSLMLAIHDLTARKKLDVRIIVAHFDHRLRGEESRDDLAYVEKLSANLGFEFVAGEALREFVIPVSGNLEQNARIARYRFLASVVRDHDASALLTAHNQNDQAETFLLNLIRGSGADGLSAMSVDTPAFSLGGLPFRLVRPLLRWAKRSDTEEFCVSRNVGFRSDPMNSDPKFNRVRVRRELIPLLSSFNPKVVETLAQSAERFAELPRTASDFEKEPRIRDLKTLDREKLYLTLREWLGHERGGLRNIALKHIEAIARLVNGRKSGRIVELPGGSIVEKSRGRLRVLVGK